MISRITLLFVIQCSMACDYYDSRLVVVNNKSYDVIVETFSDTITDYSRLVSNEYYLSHIIGVSNKTNLTEVGRQNGWPVFIRNSNNQKLNVFVFNADSVKKEGMINLIKRRKYEIISISEQELINNDWEVHLED